MDRLRQKLQALLSKRPDSLALREAYTRFLDGQKTSDTSSLELWKMVQRISLILQTEGVWETSSENDALLEQVRAELFSAPSLAPIHPPPFAANNSTSEGHEIPPAGYAQGISTLSPPSRSPLRRLSAVTWLPTELLDVINQAFFLHLLVVDETNVIPPGKSLLSVMSQPNTADFENDASALKSRVEDLVHKAFWDEALESLSTPIPSVQLPRLKLLYEDLHATLMPLLPAGHPVLITLSSPLSPTSSPLRSAVSHLREILDSLSKRCAPVRDPVINDLIHKIEDPPTVGLPLVVVETVRDILQFAEAMKKDLSQFVLGSVGEVQLRGVIRKEAQEHERKLVTQLWGPEIITSLWNQWVGTLDMVSPLGQLPVAHGYQWVLRLLQALGTNTAISCNIPISPSHSGKSAKDPTNQLPPPLFLVSPALLSIQNYIQALAISASLRSLVRLPAHTTREPSSTSSVEDFMRRIWTLLSDEIDNESGDTKLINLADEIIRVRRLVGGNIEEDEEKRLRAAVDRTLQPTDPVFVLLKRRLLLAIAERLATASKSESYAPSQTVPSRIQAGRGSPLARQPQLRVGLPGVDTHPRPTKRPEATLVVKGFEDPVLITAVTNEVQRLRDSIDWIEEVWPDVVTHNQP